MPDSILSEEEVKTFIMALATHRGDKGFSEEEAAKIVDWASEASISQVLFLGVMTGDMFVDVNAEGEVAFGLTDEGRAKAERIIKVPEFMSSSSIN